MNFKDFIKTVDESRVSQGYKTSNGFNLGSWVSERRKFKKKGKLSEERIAQLDTLGFIWDPSGKK
tara:strand:- start:698 stop:892 length:195 start_codon:yes stop_codon:yes gene_type:complete